METNGTKRIYQIALLMINTVVVLVYADYSLTDILIRPHSLNQRGIMGVGKACPKNTVAVGFKMKIQPYSVSVDNSALTAIRLVCSDNSEAKSDEGKPGQWTTELRCQGGDDHLVGGRILTEKWIGWDQDDVGALNFEALCKSGIRLRHRQLPEWIKDRGLWSREVRCPDNAPAVCGIKSRIDEDDSPGVQYQEFIYNETLEAVN